jgi:hypothetical protein
MAVSPLFACEEKEQLAGPMHMHTFVNTDTLRVQIVHTVDASEGHGIKRHVVDVQVV